MKLRCPCGNRLYDNSDFQSHKAYLIAEQDEEDFVTVLGADSDLNWDAFEKYSRAIYQCERCGRLLILRDQDVLTFAPDTPERSAQVLRSVEGENWRRHLRGRWSNGKGEVWWGFGVEDEGFETQFQTWEEVASTYFEVFERLKSNNILRDCFLVKEGSTVHKWP